MRKRTLIILTIMFVMIIAYTIMTFTGDNVIVNENLENYTHNELSFQYPESWHVETISNKSGGVNKSYFDKLINPNIGEIIINRQYIPSSEYNIPKNFIPEEINEDESKLKLTSNKKNKINDIEVYENEYVLKNDNSKIVKELWVNKNNAVYSIILYGNKSNVIDIIKNNIKISDKTLTKNPIFGTIVIPKLGCTWNIRTDTVNAYNSVWHYTKSYYPGEKGVMGISGHHTTLSAPFNHLETLTKGDKIYINDFLTQKKYTYEVVSNYDIRPANDPSYVQFKNGEKELMLETCWPPGYIYEELYCHSKLISIEPLV
ncbi:MAG: class E sortase [Methanobrevibacter sp.]|jgi:sortase A|nr:class E sortase [Candidatus Methanovirga meridionalis]